MNPIHSQTETERERQRDREREDVKYKEAVLFPPGTLLCINATSWLEILFF